MKGSILYVRKESMLMAQYREEISKQIGVQCDLGYEACIISLCRRLYESLDGFRMYMYVCTIMFYICRTWLTVLPKDDGAFLYKRADLRAFNPVRQIWLEFPVMKTYTSFLVEQ